jgi:Family of unknown function (DUF6491)
MSSFSPAAICVFGCILAVSALSVVAADATVPQEAQIPFADKGGIWNWQVVDDKHVLIQSRSRDWYQATLIGSCFNIGFAEKLAFVSNPGGSFDKFSSIRVHGQTCPLVSLVKTTPPPKKTKSKPAAPP